MFNLLPGELQGSPLVEPNELAVRAPHIRAAKDLCYELFTEQDKLTFVEGTLWLIITFESEADKEAFKSLFLEVANY